MEPLSAIALAGNVLQFIEFTSKLLSTSAEVYKSTTGTSNSNPTLEGICKQLSDLSCRLRADGVSTRGSASQMAPKHKPEITKPRRTKQTSSAPKFRQTRRCLISSSRDKTSTS